MNEYNNISDLNSLVSYMDEHIKYGYVDINNTFHENELKGLKE